MTEKKALLLVILSAFLWSTSFVAVKLGLSYIHPLWFVFYRFALGTMLYILVFCLFMRRKFDYRILKEKNLYIISLFVFLGYVFQFYGQKYTLASRTALLINLFVLWVPILAHYILGEEITRRIGIAIFLVFSGIVLLTVGRGLKEIFSSRIFLGDIIIIVASIVWAFYIVLSKDLLRRYDVHELNITSFAITTILTVPFLFFLPSHFPSSLPEWTIIFHLALVCTVLAYIAYTTGLKYAGAVKSTIFVTLEVLFNFIACWILLSERWTPVELVGGVIMVMGLIIGGKE